MLYLRSRYKSKMTSVFLKLVMLFSCLSCGNLSNEKENNNTVDTVAEKQINPPADTLHNEVNSFDISQFGTLVPLEIKDSTSGNVFEKFGIEFSGNCYECDLAVIRFNKKYIDLVNVCNENKFYRIENFTYLITKNGINITTPENQLHIAKIGDGPVYQLEIIGKPFKLAGKRLSMYYTDQKLLEKFKEHDCGDFQG